LLYLTTTGLSFLGFWVAFMATGVTVRGVGITLIAIAVASWSARKPSVRRGARVGGLALTLGLAVMLGIAAFDTPELRKPLRFLGPLLLANVALLAVWPVGAGKPARVESSG
jgi:hypothetical protein